VKNVAAITFAALALVGALAYNAVAQFDNPVEQGGISTVDPVSGDISTTAPNLVCTNSAENDNCIGTDASDPNEMEVTVNGTAIMSVAPNVVSMPANSLLVMDGVGGNDWITNAGSGFAFANGGSTRFQTGSARNISTVDFRINTTKQLEWQSSTELIADSDGTLEFRNAAASAGVTLDFSTADELVVKSQDATTLAGVLNRAYMYQVDNAVATTIGAADPNWYEVDNFTGGDTRGTSIANSDITVTLAGTYMVSATFSGTGSSNNTYKFGVSVNDVVQTTGCRAERTMGSTATTGSAAFHCLLTLAASDVVKLEVQNTGATNSFTFTQADVSVVQH
jgi:hypothetical protein